MRRCATICAALFTFAAVQPAFSGQVDPGNWDFGPDGKAFLSELKGLCPSKHLDFVSHYDMEDAQSTFLESLPRAARRRVDGAAGLDPKSGETRGCHEISGNTCEDFHMLRGLRREGLMRRFVQRLCVSYVRCVSLANCTTAPDAKGSLLSDYTVAAPTGYSLPVGDPPLPPRNH